MCAGRQEELPVIVPVLLGKERMREKVSCRTSEENVCKLMQCRLLSCTEKQIIKQFSAAVRHLQHDQHLSLTHCTEKQRQDHKTLKNIWTVKTTSEKLALETTVSRRQLV